MSLNGTRCHSRSRLRHHGNGVNRGQIHEFRRRPWLHYIAGLEVEARMIPDCSEILDERI